jgi:two-component system, NarL family, response regulator
MPPTSPIRVLIADDHAVVRVGLSSMLGNEADIKIIAEAENGQQALALYREHLPQVAILDVRMPEMDGIEALKHIKAEFPQACVLMLSTTSLDEDIALSIKAGARGYLLKTTSPSHLSEAIREAAAGKTQFSKTVHQRIDQRNQLSPREREVLAAMACGQSNKQIADQLHLSEHTIKTHVKGILVKLGSEDRTGAVAQGYARGILKI